MTSQTNVETFSNSCITSYIVFPPDVLDLHQRQFKVYSTSGKNYIVTIKDEPTCTCPDHYFRGKSCKHISFILERVLHDKFPKLLYSNKILDALFRSLPGYIIHDCE